MQQPQHLSEKLLTCLVTGKSIEKVLNIGKCALRNKC